MLIKYIVNFFNGLLGAWSKVLGVLNYAFSQFYAPCPLPHADLRKITISLLAKYF